MNLQDKQMPPLKLQLYCGQIWERASPSAAQGSPQLRKKLHLWTQESMQVTTLQLTNNIITLCPVAFVVLQGRVDCLTLCQLTILPPRYTHPSASDSPCEVWRVTNCDLYCIVLYWSVPNSLHMSKSGSAPYDGIKMCRLLTTCEVESYIISVESICMYVSSYLHIRCIYMKYVIILVLVLVQ